MADGPINFFFCWRRCPATSPLLQADFRFRTLPKCFFFPIWSHWSSFVAVIWVTLICPASVPLRLTSLVTHFYSTNSMDSFCVIQSSQFSFFISGRFYRSATETDEGRRFCLGNASDWQNEGWSSPREVLSCSTTTSMGHETHFRFSPRNLNSHRCDSLTFDTNSLPSLSFWFSSALPVSCPFLL